MLNTHVFTMTWFQPCATANPSTTLPHSWPYTKSKVNPEEIRQSFETRSHSLNRHLCSPQPTSQPDPPRFGIAAHHACSRARTFMQCTSRTCLRDSIRSEPKKQTKTKNGLRICALEGGWKFLKQTSHPCSVLDMDKCTRCGVVAMTREHMRDIGEEGKSKIWKNGRRSNGRM
ncbi:hypothetical protein DE146DRAFT_657838 [Phaeosphaeria sp. MPI-PUGE-AT-0046c]|nr:hypothetical protein DE146DRAFT_657838 [Phaeosphaeria sp. MPI-PUGE-AT-0046c]